MCDVESVEIFDICDEFMNEIASFMVEAVSIISDSLSPPLIERFFSDILRRSKSNFKKITFLLELTSLN